MQTSVLIHYGELALKGGNRSHFEVQLVKNIAVAIHPIGKNTIRRLSGRIWIEFEKAQDVESIKNRLRMVFGIASIAPAVRCEPTMEEIERLVLSLVPQYTFASFAVRAKRGEKTLPFSSQDVNQRIGAAVKIKTDKAVNLEQPELEIGIELLEQHAFIICERIPGPGGLPVGTAGKVACLLSGGIDSPVAAYRMMKRGCVPIFIHFSSIPYTNRASIEKVKDFVDHLAVGIPGAKLVIVPFGEIQQQIVRSVEEKYRVLMYRRMMLRISEAIARREGALALVTGEALSQVASQTLSNLAAIEKVVSMPVLRPLVGMDKQEIVDEAKKIGTFATACEPHQDCCSFLMPKHPATFSSVEELDRVEATLDISHLMHLSLQDLQ
ncbi:MAG: tRNA 4-thiouridine(8) synthase ThiI [Deltaproteobacteria bacterium]|nr:tRNA 4-thiouridine(8) synthase ThiI [Deltaproteobacteria bacterium]